MLPYNQLGVSSQFDVEALFRQLSDNLKQDAQSVADKESFELFRVKWLGRKQGILSRITDNWLKPAPPDAKRWVGSQLNDLRREVAHLYLSDFEAKGLFAEPAKVDVGASLDFWRAQVETKLEEAQAAAAEPVDVSLPGVERPIGARHILRQTFEEIERIFLSLGYSVVEGPEIETPYYNFEALNIPEHHPVRDTMDTFYLDVPPGGAARLLRTHTSPMQIHTMERQQPPVRIIVPGKVYRRDNPDATHSFMFHQVEGLAVDTDITFCDFKGTIEYFAQQFFGPKTKVRLRPSYFPFTEPSAEFDASCHACGGSGCRVCKFSGWIELFGAGMVDPAVYGFVNYDAKRLSGFAFGLGVDRLAMLKYGINDIQLFFQNDVRFLRQFR